MEELFPRIRYPMFPVRVTLTQACSSWLRTPNPLVTPHRFSSAVAMARHQTPTQPEGGETLTQEQRLWECQHVRHGGPHPSCAPSSAAPMRAGPQLLGEGLGQENMDWSGRGVKWSEFSFVKMVTCHWDWWDDAGDQPRWSELSPSLDPD